MKYRQKSLFPLPWLYEITSKNGFISGEIDNIARLAQSEIKNIAIGVAIKGKL